ncbi:MAG TPA: SPOR domain-containing protein [Gemmatimonadales bacterium]|nr:SPOR domain-containing protein [Gemmatimonadales bacterium]
MRRVLIFLSVLPVTPVLPLLGQTDPRLVEVIRDAQEGDSDSARMKVQQLLTATAPTDTLYPQIVYTQAMVANDAGDMRRQLQRVAVEYSSSSWADDALLRLVQLDYASGNLDGAARNLERIRLDYPGSPLVPQAAYWAARTYFDQKKPDLACRWIADGLKDPSANLELQNQLRYLHQRCGQFAAASAPARADTQARAATPVDSQPTITATTSETTLSPAPPPPQPANNPRADSASAPTAATHYRIQISAVRSKATAESVAGKLKSKGFDPITVEEAGLYKVRIGDYRTKAEAAAAVPQVKAKLGGSPFVVVGS